MRCFARLRPGKLTYQKRQNTHSQQVKLHGISTNGIFGALNGTLGSFATVSPGGKYALNWGSNGGEKRTIQIP
jgi:hypothetical protein